MVYVPVRLYSNDCAAGQRNMNNMILKKKIILSCAYAVYLCKSVVGWLNVLQIRTIQHDKIYIWLIKY